MIVTYNTRHFPVQQLASYRIQARHPEALLLDILRHHATTLHDVLIAQGAAIHPPRTITQVLDRLAQDVPRFAAEARLAFAR